MMIRKSVLIFTKIPIPGFVKTRLLNNTCLNNEDVAMIAEAMLKDSILIAQESISDRIDIAYTPKENFSFLNRILSNIEEKESLTKEIKFHLQIGTDFDEKFGSAVKSTMDSGVDYLVVIGADLPYLDPKIIDKAFSYLLNNKANVVIGPASGGGIYLLGIGRDFDWRSFSQFHLFRCGIELIEFSNYCNKNNLSFVILPPYGDIDIEEDLVSLISYIQSLSMSNVSEGFYFPRFSSETLKKLGLDIKIKDGETRNRQIFKSL